MQYIINIKQFCVSLQSQYYFKIIHYLTEYTNRLSWLIYKKNLFLFFLPITNELTFLIYIF
jgi:hypothetical protein